MGGIGSGRHKEPAQIIKEAISKDAQNLPKYFQRLSQLALGGDREALQYLIDRQAGKPKATTELQGDVGSGLIVEFFKRLEERKQIQLKEGQDAIQRQSITEGSQSGSQPEAQG